MEAQFLIWKFGQIGHLTGFSEDSAYSTKPLSPVQYWDSIVHQTELAKATYEAVLHSQLSGPSFDGSCCDDESCCEVAWEERGESGELPHSWATTVWLPFQC